MEEQRENLDKDINEKSLNLECEIKKIEDEGKELVKEIDSIRLMKLIKFDEESLTKARNDLTELKTKSSIACFEVSNSFAIERDVRPKTFCNFEIIELASISSKSVTKYLPDIFCTWQL